MDTDSPASPAVPAYDDMMQEVVDALRSYGGRATVEQINTYVARALKLPPDVVMHPHKPGMSISHLSYNLAWTRTYLRKAGLIDNLRHGIWALTPDGQKSTKLDAREIVRNVKSQDKIERQLRSDQASDEDETPSTVTSWKPLPGNRATQRALPISLKTTKPVKSNNKLGSTYRIVVFSPETYKAFSKTDHTIAGVRERQLKSAERLQIGDKLICYITKESRFCGILEVAGTPFKDEKPRFAEVNDPFVVRFKVRPVVWFPLEKAIPIREQSIWSVLSFTQDRTEASSEWTGNLRNSLSPLPTGDGIFLEKALLKQQLEQLLYPVEPSTKEEKDSVSTNDVIDNAPSTVVTTVEIKSPGLTHPLPPAATSTVVVMSVPEGIATDPDATPPAELRASYKIQALLARIGEQMGMKIWIPKADRSAVLLQWHPASGVLLDSLPLNYGDETLRTIEQIDVIWINFRSIVRAFEVEHTTAIYSGILRMADLLALQPNMKIELHIVAPAARRDKVFHEIQRPVFARLAGGPLTDSCTYLSYESVEEIAKIKHLAHLNNSVLEDYEERVL